MTDETADRTESKERILRVLVYIQTRVDEAMTLDELSRVAYFSPYHFHRV